MCSKQNRDMEKSNSGWGVGGGLNKIKKKQPGPDGRDASRWYGRLRVQKLTLLVLIPSFSNRWVHLDTVSCQIFGDIQGTQFLSSKIEVHVHLKNAFQAELETERSRLALILGSPPTLLWPSMNESIPYILVLAGSELSFTETTAYISISLL